VLVSGKGQPLTTAISQPEQITKNGLLSHIFEKFYQHLLINKTTLKD